MDNILSIKEYKIEKALNAWLKASIATAAAQSQGYLFYANQNRKPKEP